MQAPMSSAPRTGLRAPGRSCIYRLPFCAMSAVAADTNDRIKRLDKEVFESNRHAPKPQQQKETQIVCTDEEFLFDWDAEKRRINVAKHGLDFTRAIKIFSGITVERLSVKSNEVRFRATGYCEGIPLTVIYTWRGNKRRIISARRAKRNERQEYREHVPE